MFCELQRMALEYKKEMEREKGGESENCEAKKKEEKKCSSCVNAN